MREYTVQWMMGQDWHRVTAIYGNIEEAVAHANVLLRNGMVVRILGRTLGLRGQAMPWHTIKCNEGSILLDNTVYGCQS